MGKRGKNMQAELLFIMRGKKNAHSAYNLLEELKGRHPKIAPTTDLPP